MMVYCLNASGGRCYHPCWYLPPQVTAAPPASAAAATEPIDPPEAPPASAGTIDPAEASAAPITAPPPPASCAAPRAAADSPGANIRTGVTLDITMHDSPYSWVT